MWNIEIKTTDGKVYAMRDVDNAFLEMFKESISDIGCAVFQNDDVDPSSIFFIPMTRVELMSITDLEADDV